MNHILITKLEKIMIKTTMKRLILTYSDHRISLSVFKKLVSNTDA